MSAAGLSAKEQEHLAVLLVSVLAADPAEVRMLTRRADVLVPLEAVDRMSRLARADCLTVVRDSVIPAFFAGSATVYQRFGGGSDE